MNNFVFQGPPAPTPAPGPGGAGFPWASAGNAAGALISGAFAYAGAKKAAKTQKEIVKKGLGWRVADAKKSGIHPLFALGYNQPIPSMPNIEGQLGQGIGRAVEEIGRGMGQRSVQARAQQIHEAQLENIQSDTALNLARASQASRISGAGNAQPGVVRELTGEGIVDYGPNQLIQSNQGKLPGEQGAAQKFVIPGPVPGTTEEFWLAPQDVMESGEIVSFLVNARIATNMKRQKEYEENQKKNQAQDQKAKEETGTDRKWWFGPKENPFFSIRRK